MTFKQLITEGINEKQLFDAFEKEFNSYGGPSNKSPLKEFLESEITNFLNDSLRDFMKTAKGKECAREMALSNLDEEDDEFDYEVEYMIDEYEYEVSIDVRPSE